MFRRRLDVLDAYEVVGQPLVGATRLSYVPWITQALEPYGATRLPTGPALGLREALARAAATAA